MLPNFKPAGCETNKHGKMQSDVVKYAVLDDDDDEYDDDDDDEFIFDFEVKKSTSNIFKSNQISFKEENKTERILTENQNNQKKIFDEDRLDIIGGQTCVTSQVLLTKSIESDLVIDFKQAIINQNYNKVKKLVKENSNEIGVNYLFKNSWSPLMFAISSGCCELVEYFISEGADVNHQAGI